MNAPTPEVSYAAQAAHGDRRKADLARERLAGSHKTVGKLFRAVTSCPIGKPTASHAAVADAPARRRRRPKGEDDPMRAVGGGVGPRSLSGGPVLQTLFESPAPPPVAVTVKIRRRIHHLRFTFPVQRADATDASAPNVATVREAVALSLGVMPEDRLKGLWSYESGCSWHDVEGRELAGLFWTEGRGEACVDIRGGGCDRLTLDKKLRLLHLMRELGGKCVRVDLAFDDYDRIASMDEVHAACAANNLTGFKVYEPERAWNISSQTLEKDVARLGRRGSKGSGTYLRVYDKFLETGRDPEFNCIRYEAELTDQKAHAAFTALVECKDAPELEAFIGSLLAGCVDFIDRGAVHASHVERAARLSWWRKLCKLMCCLLVTSLTLPSLSVGPVSRGIRHFKKQWTRLLSLARVVAQSDGWSFSALLEKWLDEAEPTIDWDQQGKRDLTLNLRELLAL